MQLIVFDLETTGQDPYRHEIIEAGYVIYEVHTENVYTFNSWTPAWEISRWSAKVKPKHIETADPVSLEINGYSEDAWADAIDIEEAFEKMRKPIEGSILMLGHNLIFDLKFIRETGRREHFDDIRIPLFYVDTKYQAIKSKSGSFKGTKISQLCEEFEIQTDGELHTSIGDCLRTFEVWQNLRVTQPSYWSMGSPFYFEDYVV